MFTAKDTPRVHLLLPVTPHSGTDCGKTPAEKEKLLRMVLSNCAVDAASVYPTYRKSFGMIFERAKTEEWWAWVDSNNRPHPYQGCALTT